ncbi:MAG: SCP2 sterol-binding domain-containing protein [bacterium]|nr:SCP2 sterol-binding domain-containing protein [bacterium]
MSDFSPKQFFEGKVTETLKKKAEKLSSIKSIFEFQLSGDNGGTWTVDLTGGEGKVLAGSSGKPDVTVKMSDENFVKLVSGQLNGQMAFMTGKIKVQGKLGLALKLQSILT